MSVIFRMVRVPVLEWMSYQFQNNVNVRTVVYASWMVTVIVVILKESNARKVLLYPDRFVCFFISGR